MAISDGPTINGRHFSRVEACGTCATPLGVDEDVYESESGRLNPCETVTNGYRCDGCGKLVCFPCDPEAKDDPGVCPRCLKDAA